MNRVAVALAVLLVGLPAAAAGAASWSWCVAPEPQRCCCPGNAPDNGCGCGCGAGRTPARAPEPVAAVPQAPEHGLAPPSMADSAPTDAAPRPLAATAPERPIPAADLTVVTCTFRC